MKIMSLIIAGVAGSMYLGFIVVVIYSFFDPRHSVWIRVMDVAFLLMAAFWIIQGAIIGPALRGFDQSRFSDWFDGTHQGDRLEEYRRLCSEHGHPLFWANVQRGLMLAIWFSLRSRSSSSCGANGSSGSGSGVSQRVGTWKQEPQENDRPSTPLGKRPDSHARIAS